jgi:hypothetical protein
MSVTRILRAMLCIAAMVVLFSAALPNTATAQCPACATWWVDYDYIFPPCIHTVFVDVQWANGLVSHVSSNSDGHIIYQTPQALSPAVSVTVNGFSIPVDGTVAWVPYPCEPLENMCLKVEIRCNPCLEIKVRLEPCP